MSKYIIVGPGASGKDYLQKKMIDLGYHPMKQYTTREIRENETVDEYHFISKEEFDYMDVKIDKEQERSQLRLLSNIIF